METLEKCLTINKIIKNKNKIINFKNKQQNI